VPNTQGLIVSAGDNQAPIRLTGLTPGQRSYYRFEHTDRNGNTM
jgi:hypothetical protein